MTRNDYILSQALPFDLGSLDADGEKLLNAAPSALWAALSRAESHEDEVTAGDAIADWISANWRGILPTIAARF